MAQAAYASAPAPRPDFATPARNGPATVEANRDEGDRSEQWLRASLGWRLLDGQLQVLGHRCRGDGLRVGDPAVMDHLNGFSKINN
jgi:hypothetical protein